ncbi:MAG: glycosyltransferase family 2 protein [Cyclobacteriaceae bacterium]
MKFSIITINYNNKNGLKKTIESVVSQVYTDYEYIVIDGGSADGSKEEIEENANKISFWVSEPDKGIYNAMNKGLKQAKGDYCLFLNSGDYFVDGNVLSKVAAIPFIEDIVAGDIVVEETGVKVKAHAEVSMYEFFKRSLPHQASFIKKEILDKMGGYDENYKILSDWNFVMLAIFKYNYSYRRIDETVAFFEAGGISSNFFNKRLEEKERTMRSDFPELSEVYLKAWESERMKQSGIVKLAVRISNLEWYKNIMRYKNKWTSKRNS